MHKAKRANTVAISVRAILNRQTGAILDVIVFSFLGKFFHSTKQAAALFLIAVCFPVMNSIL
jgi:hypothetical protein